MRKTRLPNAQDSSSIRTFCSLKTGVAQSEDECGVAFKALTQVLAKLHARLPRPPVDASSHWEKQHSVCNGADIHLEHGGKRPLGEHLRVSSRNVGACADCGILHVAGQ